MPPRRRGPICSATNRDLCLTPGTLSMRDAWDVSQPNAIRSKRGLQGAISLAEGGGVVLARAGGLRARHALRRARTRIYSELNIVGSFPLKGNPWKSHAEILADMRLDRWFPTDGELSLFADSKRPKNKSKILKLTDVYAFLNALYSYPAKRVNLFTHGTSLSGHVVKGNVFFTTGKQYHLLGTWYYEATNPGFRFIGKKHWRKIQDLHKIMPSGAKLIIYGCKSGSKRDDLKRLSKLLGIVVQGFSKSIIYHPVMSRDGKKIIDWRYSHGKNGKKVDDYHKINPDISTRISKRSN